MISKHPEDVYWMIQAAKKPVDTLEIHNHVSTTVSTVRNTVNILRIIGTKLQSLDWLPGYANLSFSSSFLSKGTSIGWVVDELQPHITRAVDYLKSGHVRNSTAILETLTPQIAEWAAENGSLIGHSRKSQPSSAISTLIIAGLIISSEIVVMISG